MRSFITEMSRARFSVFLSYSLPTLSRAAVLVLLLTTAASALASDTAQSKAAEGCGVKLTFDDGADVNALRHYQDAVVALLQERAFAELDCIADAARSSKTRFSGGNWKLHRVYYSLSEIEGHAAEEDWKERLRLIEDWVDERPKSVTARVALADAYASYAWNARGSGMADTVTENGWRLFAERLEYAKQILEQAKSLDAQCPEWFAVMQRIALGQGWSIPEARVLFEQAVASEPLYYTYYRQFAVSLLPKWNGEEGDTAKFADEIANRIGGEEGDIVYFQIADELACPCQGDPEFTRLSWPRVHKGYDELEKRYGTSLVYLNRFALMAMNSTDSIAADAAFRRIGDNWHQGTWNTEDSFRGTREQAARMAPQELRGRALEAEAAANLQTPDGLAYRKATELKFAELMRMCAQSTPGASNEGKIELVVRVAADGELEDVWMPHFKYQGLGYCVFQRLREARFQKEALLPPPPKPSYAVETPLDSSMFVARSQP